MIRFAFFFIALAACGRTELDVPLVVDAASDVATDARHMCEPAALFTSISRFPVDAGKNATDVRLTPDELTAYFIRERQDALGYEAASTHRVSIDAPFSTPIVLTGIANSAGAVSPNPSPDNLDLVFEDGACVLVTDHVPAVCGAHRDTPDAAFSEVFDISVGTGVFQFAANPYTTHAGTVMYFEAWPPGQFAGAVARAPRIDAKHFGSIERVAVDGVPPDAFLGTPVVTEDEKVLFISVLAAEAELATVTLATRNAVTQSFVTVRTIDEISGVPNWVSPDGCRLYFTGPVDSDAGPESALFVAER